MDKMGKIYKSMIEIQKEFYPEDYERKRIEKMTFAEIAIESIKPELEKILKDL